MYTWGYIKNSTLAKLDLEQSEAVEMKIVNKFLYFANEAMTQICSAVKPKRTFYEVFFYEEAIEQGNLVIVDGIRCEGTLNDDKTVTDTKHNLTYYPIGYIMTMPKDFIAFGDDVCTREYHDFQYNTWYEECHDDVLKYIGYNQFTCKEKGKYQISYKARWFDFSDAIETTNLSCVPTDVLECIPSYIAHQCYKTDDEYKSSVYRNEYEMFLARIDDTTYENTKTFKIEGDW